MNPRERTMAILLATVVALVFGYQGVRRWIVDPIRDRINDNEEMRVEIGELETKLELRPQWEQRWQARTALTLSSSQDEAELAFREDVHDLLVKAGFANWDLRKPSANWHFLYKDAKFGEIALQINAEGKLANVVNFMREFYQRPYVKNLRRMVLTVNRQRKAPLTAEPTLDVRLTVTTVVVPRVLDIEPLPYDPNVAEPRFDEEMLATFTTLASQNLFRKWVEPKRVVAPPTQETTRETPTVVQAPPEPPPIPPPDKTLIAVEAINGHYFAYVRDNERLELPPEELTLGSPIHDGTLVLIHPSGIVVRVEEESPEDGDDGAEPVVTDYFYALGAPFEQREELDEAYHPHVFEALQTHLSDS